MGLRAVLEKLKLVAAFSDCSICNRYQCLSTLPTECPTSPMSVKTMRGYCEEVKNYFKQGYCMKLLDKTSEEKSSLGQHEDLVIVVEDLNKVESGSQDRCQAVVGEDEDIQDCEKERLLMLEESKV